MSFKRTAAALLASGLILLPVFKVVAAQNIGIVDLQGIVRQIPQTAEMQAVLQAEFAPLEQQVKVMQETLKYNMEKQQRDALTMSDAEKQQLAERVLTMRQEFSEKAQQLEGDARQRQSEEQSKILALVKQVIDQIAAEKGYDMILDASSVMYIRAGTDFDISEEAIKRLSGM